MLHCQGFSVIASQIAAASTRHLTLDLLEVKFGKKIKIFSDIHFNCQITGRDKQWDPIDKTIGGENIPHFSTLDSSGFYGLKIKKKIN